MLNKKQLAILGKNKKNNQSISLQKERTDYFNLFVIYGALIVGVMVVLALITTAFLKKDYLLRNNEQQLEVALEKNWQANQELNKQQLHLLLGEELVVTNLPQLGFYLKKSSNIKQLLAYQEKLKRLSLVEFFYYQEEQELAIIENQITDLPVVFLDQSIFNNYLVSHLEQINQEKLKKLNNKVQLSFMDFKQTSSLITEKIQSQTNPQVALLINIPLLKKEVVLQEAEHVDFNRDIRYRFLSNYELQEFPIFTLNDYKRKLVYSINYDSQSWQEKLVLDREKLKKYLLEEVEPQIARQKEDGEIGYQNGYVSFSNNIKEGIALDIEKTINLTEQLINTSLEDEITMVDLPLIREKPVLKIAEELKEQGITELLVQGISDFTLSSYSRINNVKAGLNRFTGRLIDPGKRVSFNAILGPVNGAMGYLPEMVIKGNKNEEEYGGGLCQVSSTVYRAAMLAGFEIVKRRPHSYLVQYYHPAGSDATIYPPYPDVVFINNTDHKILLQTYTEGVKAFVNIYGSDDGRQVHLKGPFIYDMYPAPPAQYVRTSTLPTGKVVQYDWAHPGLTSKWWRTVTFADERETIQEEIVSKYRNWAAKYLIGM